MKKTMILLFALATLVSAEGFLDIPASSTWTKVQDGEVTQWSVITPAHPKVRIDLVSYLEKDGARTSYYMVRSTCTNGEVAKYVIKPGNQLGLGVDCNGSVVSGTSTPIVEAPKLPAEAAALLKR